MTETLTRFKVNLWNFGAQGVVIKASAKEGADDKSKAKLYFKLDFDKGHTVLESKPARETADAVAWGVSKAFEYATKHGDKLQRKSVRIACWRSIMLFPDKEVGSAQVDLHTLATGPTRLDLVLRDENENPVGHIFFEATMNQVVERTIVTLSNVRLRMRPGEPDLDPDAQLVLCYGRVPYVKVTSRKHANSCTSTEDITWADMPILPLQECSCFDLARESVYITVTRNGATIGTAEVNLGPVFVVGSLQSQAFEAEVTTPDGATAVADIAGNIAFRDAPHLAQLVNGVLSETGIVEATEIFPGRGPPRLMVQGAEKPKSLADADVGLPEFSLRSSETETLPTETDASESADPALANSASHVKRVMLAKEKFKSLMTPPSEDLRQDVVILKQLDSDSVRNLVNQLQQTHEVTFAGLQQGLDDQRQRQRQRLELRRKQRQQRLPSAPAPDDSLESNVEIPASAPGFEASALPTASTAQDDGTAGGSELANATPLVEQTHHSLPQKLENLLRDAERSMFQDLDAKPPLEAMVNPQRCETPLPARWERRFDAEGRAYFTYPREYDDSVFTTWEDPRLVPSDWEMRVDSGVSAVTFFHEPTGLTVFHDPRGLPDGWLCFPDFDTKALTFMYGDSITTQDPRGLPPGWKASIDNGSGKLVFAHEAVVGLDPSADPRKLSGVTDELRHVWRQMQLLEWIDARAIELGKTEKRVLANNAEAAQKIFADWQAEQHKIVSAQFEALQLNLLAQNPPPADVDAQEVIRRFRARERSLLQGWEAEAAKLQEPPH